MKGTRAVVVLGKNWRAYPPRNRPAGWRLHLSIESKMAVLAAGHLFRSGHADMILISSGKTAGPDWPSEAEAMRDYLKRRYPGIPDESILLESISIDTPENAEQVSRILRAHEPQPVTLLTIGFHLPRSMKIFRTFGITAERGMASEDVLAERSLHHRTFIVNYLKSWRVKSERVKEALLRLLLLVDPEATIPRLQTKRLRQ